MIEIWIPEAIIVLFLALPLLRPFFKKWWPLDGLAWLPFVALGIAIGIFPAYGFRPECIPILIFALIASINSRFENSFRNFKPAATVCAFVLLGAAAIPLFVFSSRDYTPPERKTIVTMDGANRMITPAGFFERKYTLQVYGAMRENQPLLFLVPPEIGSIASIDLVCAELEKKGFTVVTYSYRDYSVLRPRYAFSAKLPMYWHIFRRAAIFASANERGKSLEADRRIDIEFLLPRLPAALGYARDADLPPFLLVGYGAGGSALAYLAGESDFISSHNQVIGVVAIESHLWSAYLPQTRDVPQHSVSSGIIRRQWENIVNHMYTIWPQQVGRTGPLPHAGIPVLYIVSGRALDSSWRQKPYRAVFDSVRFSAGPVALAAIGGAGPLDYQDYPFTHPLYSFLLPGLKGVKKNENPIGDTTGIIGNFASLLLNTSPRHTIGGNLYTESKGFSEFRLQRHY